MHQIPGRKARRRQQPHPTHTRARPQLVDGLALLCEGSGRLLQGLLGQDLRSGLRVRLQALKGNELLRLLHRRKPEILHALSDARVELLQLLLGVGR
eukprot:2410456-Alexandrium_andersonii.AAC.1